jgi:ribosomal protein S3
LLFLSSIYNNTKIFSSFVALQLKKNKNHKKVLRKITLIIEIFWKNKNTNLRGMQFRVTGKLNGSMRKSKYHYSIGKVQLQSFNTFLDYSFSISYTKFGILSTKLWILYGNK